MQKSSHDLIKELSHELGMLPEQLKLIVRTAPLRYKVFTIPKRDGTPRTVAQPAREVKSIQRWAIRTLGAILPVHHAATAYQPGTSIKINAENHVNNDFLLKMDLKEFFPSIGYSDICNHLKAYSESSFDDSAIAMIARICTWAPQRHSPLQLCIGAPSSPLISNSILYDFDCKIAQASLENRVSYTRYADDLTFSTKEKNILSSYPKIVSDILASIPSPSLKINKKKTVFASRSGLRVVTGIVLTPNHEISAGRERKRLARAMYHHYKTGRLPEDQHAKMWGLIAFIDHLEPGFLINLNRST